MELIKDRLGVRALRVMVVAALMVATIAVAVLLSALVIDDDPSPSQLPAAVDLVYSSFVVPARGLARGEARCPAGKVVTGGGTYANAVSSTLLVLDSGPVRSRASYAWRARFSNKSRTEISVGAVAVCATVAPSQGRPSTVATTGGVTRARTPGARPRTSTTKASPRATTTTTTRTTTEGR